MGNKEWILQNFFQIEIYPIERRINDTKGCIWFYIFHTMVLFIMTLLVLKTQLAVPHIIIASIFALFLVPLLIWRFHIKQKYRFSLTFLFECVIFFLGMLQSCYVGFIFLYIDQQKLTFAHLITCIVGFLIIIIVLISKVQLYRRRRMKIKKNQTIPIFLTSIAVAGALFGRSLYRVLSRYVALDIGLLGSICCLGLSLIWAMFGILQAYNFYVSHINHLDMMFEKV